MHMGIENQVVHVQTVCARIAFSHMWNCITTPFSMAHQCRAQIHDAAAPATSAFNSPGRCHVIAPTVPLYMARQCDFAAPYE